MFCPNCGEPIIEGKSFCANCGEKIVTAQQSAPQQAQPQAQPQQMQYQAQPQYQQSAPQQPQPQYRQQQPQPQPQPQYQQPAPQQPQPQPKKKSPLPIILGIVGGVLVTIAAIVVALFLIGNKAINDATAKESTKIEKHDKKGKKEKKEPEIIYDTAGSEGLDIDFDSADGTDGYVVTGIGSCSDKDIVVPQGVEKDGKIVPYLYDEGDGFRNMENVRSVTLPDGVLEVRSGFANSPNLQFVYIPGSVKKISADAFDNCSSFIEVIFAGTMDQWDAVGFGNDNSFDIVCADGKINGSGSAGAMNEAGDIVDGAGSVATEVADAADEGGAIDGSPADIAKMLSTDDFAKALDFEWVIDYYDGDGNGAGVVVTDPSRADKIDGSMSDYLNGGWKAFMYGSKNVNTYNSEGERYFNADIDTNGSDFNITMNWKYANWGDESIEESGSDLCKGKWDSSDGSATAQGSFCNVKINGFYISKDRKAMYAVGTFLWQSGETDAFALMRVLEE